MRRHRILVVDDEAALRELLEEELELLGYEVLTSPSGNSALETLAHETVSAILSDVRMPNGDGIQLLAAVKRSHPPPPVILISGFSDLTEEAAAALGAFALLKKPYSSDELAQTLERAVRLAQDG